MQKMINFSFGLKSFNTRGDNMPKKVNEIPSNNEIIGFGDKVVKITDQETGEVVAYFGIQDEKEKVYFSKPISIEGLEAVHELLQKKKFNKHIANERFDKAQNFANRKF
jgi:hypothetical protein